MAIILISLYKFIIIWQMSRSGHLSTFTSIISLLKVKNPSMSEQLDCLRQAVIHWHESMQHKILAKNKALMSARTRGSQKLYILLNQIQNYFNNITRSYSDPNLPKFYKKFMKIKEQFQFVDIDYEKFSNRLRNKEIQTDRESIYMYGDVNKFIHGVENKQLELQHSKDKIVQLEEDINNYKMHIQELSQKLIENEEEFRKKDKEIEEIKDQIEKNKLQAVSSARNQTQRKNNIVYRSNPQINNFEGFSNRKIIMNLLSHAKENQSVHQNNEISIQEMKVEKDPEFFTILYSQALAIEGMLASVQAYQRTRIS